MSEDTKGLPGQAVKKVRLREEKPPDDKGGSEQTEPVGSMGPGRPHYLL
ncbi:hypothetical protein Goshw_025961 [Gossypium schwendimanii]|uniref:Uncharacterized protein n=1 Tax=Gossypium schwendimanii TaxID=34291 RepID=A0A7J9MDT7_GOSSC|nr:hypothetical protein [Gossypium schwendimanii]